MLLHWGEIFVAYTKRHRDIFNKGEYLEKEKIYFLGRTGEYGTIAKLYRYGIDAFLTNGNRKAFDIIATKNHKNAYLQVKTSKEQSFPTRFFQKYYDNEIPSPDFWVFVYSFPETNWVYKERYFILAHEELKQIQGQFVLPYFKKEGASTIEDVMRIEKDKILNKKPVGVDKIPLNLISSYEDRFDKIWNFLN